MPLSEPNPRDPLPVRYAPRVPLPRYRYVPGLNPHPIRHPDGHLHGVRSERVGPPENGDWTRHPPHRFACDLFHQAYWWEAHEAWEALWHEVERGSPEWLALRGLIQASAALLKRHLGHDAAATILRRKACEQLRQAATIAGGARVLGLRIEAVADALEVALDRGPPPVLTLED